MNFSTTTTLILLLLLNLAFLGKKVNGAVKQMKPNIIYFLIDDWGYNDVGYYGNTDTDTPFINKLVKEESLRLDRYYVLPECTATRCALLTGRYPMRYGMQDGILYYQSPYALSAREYLLSSEFQENGYATHIVGKWHLGMMANEYTPTYRGFDTFVGFYAGLIYYYSHYGIEDSYPDKIDFHNNLDGWHEEDRYTMYTYQDRILNIIDEYATTDSTSKHKQTDLNNNDNELTEKEEEQKPFFLYVGWQGSHYPSEAPDEYSDKYASDDKDRERQYFQAQTTLTDELLEELVTHLKDTGVWDNTLLIVASDNGADYGYGDNSPLRGSKFTLWEGGIRVPAFVTGGYLPESRKGSVLDDIPIHVTDWYPTLLAAAGIHNHNTPNELDGINIWKYFENGDEHRTDEVLNDRVILLNADQYGCGSDFCGAILYGGRWKLVTGTNQLVSWESGSPELNSCFWHRDFSLNEYNDVFQCGVVPNDLVTSTCACSQELCLFDLANDPCEYYNVYNDNLEIADMLTDLLESYYNEQTLVLFDTIFNVATVIAAKGDHGGYWEPWADSTSGWNGWKNLKFEKLLAPYYSSQGKTEKTMDESLNALWIGLIIAGLGFVIFILFIIWRFCCLKQIRKKVTKNRESARMPPKKFKGENVDINNNNTNNGTIINNSVNMSDDNVINNITTNTAEEEEEERLPLKTNEVGSSKTYSTNNNTASLLGS